MVVLMENSRISQVVQRIKTLRTTELEYFPFISTVSLVYKGVPNKPSAEVHKAGDIIYVALCFTARKLYKGVRCVWNLKRKNSERTFSYIISGLLFFFPVTLTSLFQKH